jgi:hypothetical protein
MNLSLDLDGRAEESVRLFALATTLGMYAGVDAQGARASVEGIGPDALLLRLTGADPESLLSLRRMLTLGGSTVPAALQSLPPARAWTSFDAILMPRARGSVSLAAVEDLSGDAFFLSVKGVSSPDLYDVVRPVVDTWQQLLRRQALPYRFDEEDLVGLDTEGVEVYELSETEVQVATIGYGGGEDGVVALINGIAKQLQLAGLAFEMRGWTG